MSARPSPASTVARAGFAVLALVVCAWFALGVRSFADQNAVNDSITKLGAVSAAQAGADRAALSQAATLNPDQGVNLLRAQLEARLGRRRAALAIAEQVARREPENISAWLLIAVVANRGTAAYRTASARVHALAPPVPQ